jgi:hypothetical protein
MACRRRDFFEIESVCYELSSALLHPSINLGTIAVYPLAVLVDEFEENFTTYVWSS